MNPPKNYFVGRGNAIFEAIDADAKRLDNQLQIESDMRIKEERDAIEEAMARAYEEERIAEEQQKEAEVEANRVLPYDGNMLMSFAKLEAFVEEATAHAARCGSQLQLRERDTTNGAYVKMIWWCPCCGGDVTFHNCERVRSGEIAQGTSHSRLQPDFNLRMIKGATLAGINTQKAQEYLYGHLGLNTPADKNWRVQQTKVRASIKSTFEERKIENRVEHNAAERAKADYDGDISCTIDGKECSVAKGTTSQDGAAPTRSYGGKHRSKQSAFVVNSRTTGNPLALVLSQVSSCFNFAFHIHTIQILTLYCAD